MQNILCITHSKEDALSCGSKSRLAEARPPVNCIGAGLAQEQERLAAPDHAEAGTTLAAGDAC